jgi:hypothetical protein
MYLVKKRRADICYDNQAGPDSWRCRFLDGMGWAFPSFCLPFFLYYTTCAVVHHALEKFAKL